MEEAADYHNLVCFTGTVQHDSTAIQYSFFLTTVRPNAASEIKTPESCPRSLPIWAEYFIEYFSCTVVFLTGLTVRPV